MTDHLTIAAAQLNPTVGDIAGNVAKLRRARETAAGQGAELIVASELCVAGYPPEDLVLNGDFVAACERATRELAGVTAAGPALVVGTPWRQDGRLYNAAALLEGGRVAALRFKHELPNYGVFDEKRVFAAGPAPGPVAFRGVRLGLLVCEDMWTPDATETLEESGAELLLVLNGSPFESDKGDERLAYAVARIKESGLPLLYVNQVCGQDELVFDGGSFALDAGCHLRFQAPQWREAVLATTWRRGTDGRWSIDPGVTAKPDERLPAIYRAMVLGLGDYVRKNGFPGVVLGLSGGIDSALAAAVAVDALGADRVHCVMMPSPWTSQESVGQAAAVAARLGCALTTIAIEPAMQAMAAMLGPAVAGVAAENVQARLRGMTLMALSNSCGWMVLSTGNKSELSTGYATLYGDMAGGFAVLKDVYKTTVFALARWRNRERPEGLLGPDGPVIPDGVIARPPSAELRPGQTDQDTLPPYPVLDDVLECLVERGMGLAETVGRGHPEALVRTVLLMLQRAEYKRRQAPPGVKLTRRAFGRDRRYPITNGFAAAPPPPTAEPGETPRAPDAAPGG